MRGYPYLINKGSFSFCISSLDFLQRPKTALLNNSSSMMFTKTPQNRGLLTNLSNIYDRTYCENKENTFTSFARKLIIGD